MSIQNGRVISALFCTLTILNANCYASDQKALIGNGRIQNFNNDFVDHETIQGLSWNTVGYESQEDPKNTFFLRMELNENFPESGYINSYEQEDENTDSRSKRQTEDDEILDTGTIRLNKDIGDELSTQQQEPDMPDTLQMSTETVASTTEIKQEEHFSENNFIPINDFIRFRRGLNPDSKGEIDRSVNDSNRQGEGQHFSIENENLNVNNNRGTRGLSTEEWVKFPYQIRRTQKSEDSFGSPSDLSRPRRVQFITQKQFQVDNPPVSSGSRQARVLDQPRQSRDQPRAEIDVRKSPELFSPRFNRDFDGPADYPAFPYSRGRYYERDLIENRRPDSRSLDFPPRNRDRRIIYYANLPEIPRGPPRFRDMGRYMSPFDDRYSANPYQRDFYRNQRNEDFPPMKVLTNVNVREIKKNPEKRIYSDVKRKYGYDTPSFGGDETTRN